MKKEIPLSRAHRIVNHGPVVLVTTQVENGSPNIMAVAWIAPVSQVPPLVAISVGNGHYSHRLVSESGEFVVNVPSSSMASKVMVCGKVSGRDIDKFKKARLTPIPAKEVGPPLVEECIGHLECRLDHEVRVGDHTLFIGRVVKAWVEEGLFKETWRIDKEGGKALHHLGGNVFAVSGEMLVIEE